MTRPGKLRAAMLDLAKAIHEAIGIESPRLFIAVIALVGFFLFGALGWIVDAGYRAKLREQVAQTQTGTAVSSSPPASPATSPIASTPSKKADNNKRHLAVPRPLETPKAETAKSEPQPAPVVRDLRIISQERIPSDDASLPYGLKVVVQTTATIQPVSIAFQCDGEIGSGVVSFAGDAGEIFIKGRSGVLLDHRDVFLVSFESPAFLPEKAMILELFSKGAIRVTEFGPVPFRFP